jgi:serine/threonine protein phosphatase PrpC
MGETSLAFEVSTALSKGARVRQEDALACDVPEGGAAGLVVLADGCGGHAGGEIASRTAVEAALGELGVAVQTAARLPELLRQAVEAANAAVRAHAVQAQMNDMRTTLLALVLRESELYWASVGDSPLYLLREGRLRRLNETHSLAAHLDVLVAAGEMTAREADAHPARHCLTSALGAQNVERIDCPDMALALRAGDAIVAASDGVMTLGEAAIAAALAPEVTDRFSSPASALRSAILDAATDSQDNIAIAVLQVRDKEASRAFADKGYGQRYAMSRVESA